MKILGLKFKNISAMKGEWEIRFDQPPLADTGLFAIVGPNGSGKTTILDALTLALYGETPRLRNPELGLMNWQALDSSSEVTFSVGGSVYRGRWSVSRAAGSPETAEMQLISLNGQETVLENRVIKVRDRVAELTGLDFKRFCRSILLAQGEFTAFLNALENERAEILEKIIGPEMARELEKSIRSRAEAENERLLELKEIAGSFPILDKGRQDELQESLEQTREGLQETDRRLEELESQEKWYERLEFLASAQRDAAEVLAAAEAHYAQSEADLERLEQARTAIPFQEDITVLDALKSEADKARSQFNQMETDIQSCQERMRELEERLRENRLELEQARKQLESRGGDMHQALLLDREIAAESARFQDALARYEALERAQKGNLQQQADVEKQLVEIQIRREELDRWLEAHSGDGSLEADNPVIEETLSSLKAFRQQLGEQKPRETDAAKAERRTAGMLKRAERAAQKVQRKTERLGARKTARERRLGELLADNTFESLFAGYRDRKKQLSACKKLVKTERKYREHAIGEDPLIALARIKSEQNTLAHSLTLEQGHLTELEKTVQWRETLKKYSPERSALKSGAPCPLCGALDHPFAEQGLPDFGNNYSEWQDQQKKIKAMQQEMKALNAKAADIQAQAKAVETINGAWTKLCAQAGGEWAITDLDSVWEEIRSRKTELKHLKARIRAVRWHKWRTQWVGRSLDRKLEKLARKEQKRDRLRGDHELQLNTAASLKNELDRLRRDEQEAREELTNRLSDYGEQLPGPNMETDLVQRLRQRWEIYRRQWQELGDLADQSRSLETRKQTLPHEIYQLEHQAETLAPEIQAGQERLSTLQTEREGLFGTFDPVQERHDLENEMDLRNAERLSLKQEIESSRRTLVEKQPALPQAEKEALKAQIAVEEAEQKILAQSIADGFGSIDTIREHLLWVGQQELIAERRVAAEQALAEARSQAEATRSALESTRSERVAADPPEMVRWKIADGTKQRDALQAEIEATDGTLQKQREMEQEHREILRAIAQQEKIFAQATAERKALDSQDPATAKTKLQRLMLERLVEQSNRHLEVLSSRYYLRSLAEEGLGLEIEDALQGRTHRSVKTLSGGESFLVSLCLALGLSEMASNGRKIESLFLDEGFGTLDDEMLYKVIAALKGLRANGKMVGIISHVKRLAEEIPTQIRVEKQPGGFSRIAVVA
jgi:exonuclease SbcC